MTRVVVTGGTGFVGANLVRRLIADGYQPHLLVRPQFSSWRIDSIRDQVTLHEVGLDDADRLTAVLKEIQPSWVFHLAAHGAYSWQTDEAQMHETNILGTRNLLKAAIDLGVDAFVNTGSSSEYGRMDHAPAETEEAKPDTPYGKTKGIATYMCFFGAQMHGARVRTLRLYSAYGPFEDPRRLLPSLIVHGRRGVFPALVNPQTARDFVYVDDVVDACLLAAQHAGAEPGAIYNVGRRPSAKPLTWLVGCWRFPVSRSGEACRRGPGTPTRGWRTHGRFAPSWAGSRVIRSRMDSDTWQRGSMSTRS